MKHKMIASVVALAFGFVVSTAAACPNEKTTTANKDRTVTTVADKAKTGSKPCGFKGATTVADKAKAGFSHPCGLKAAATVADKAKSDGKPCCGNCVPGKPCCGNCAKTATTVADKANLGSAPCPFKSATTVADKAKTGSKPCCGKCTKTAAAKGEGCPIAKKVEAVLASMPAVKYRVGEEVIGCSKGAAAMAEKTDKPVEYLIREEVFTNKGEAMVRLASLLEKEAETLQTMQFVAGGKCTRCPFTAKSIAKETNSKVLYRVGGVDFAKKEDAKKAVKLVSDALAGVKMGYKVDGKTFRCDKLAGAKCKESGKKLVYVVGEKETCCQTTAKLRLNEVKVRKIVETAVAASFSL